MSNHDPLCPVIPADENFSDWGCQCYLIAKVRADMVQRLVETSYYHHPSDPAEQGYNAGREIAIEVLSNAVAG